MALQDPIAAADFEPVRSKRWTRAECEVLVEHGLIDPQRYELIEGELIERVSKLHPHVRALVLLCHRLNRIFGDLRVLHEASIHLSAEDTPYNDPEPDVVVLNRPYSEFQSKPDPEDIVLVVEVSYSSLRLDTIAKASLYARAGIADYWVLDIKGRRIIVHREPANGSYRSVTIYGEEEQVTPLAASSASIRAIDLL